VDRKISVVIYRLERWAPWCPTRTVLLQVSATGEYVAAPARSSGLRRVRWTTKRVQKSFRSETQEKLSPAAGKANVHGSLSANSKE
jgi:hypothetical protein